MARSGRSVKDSLPVEIKRPTKDFIDAVSQVTESIRQLEQFQHNSSKLTSLDSARVDLTTAYAINSLFWVYLVSKGQNPRDHDVKKELDRLREHMKRLKQLSTVEGDSNQTVESGPSVKIDKQAAKRIVKHALWSEPGPSDQKKIKN